MADKTKPAFTGYRVVQSERTDYFATSDECKRTAATTGGKIECYVFGIGWWPWCEAMKDKKSVKHVEAAK